MQVRLSVTRKGKDTFQMVQLNSSYSHLLLYLYQLHDYRPIHKQLDSQLASCWHLCVKILFYFVDQLSTQHRGNKHLASYYASADIIYIIVGSCITINSQLASYIASEYYQYSIYNKLVSQLAIYIDSRTSLQLIDRTTYVIPCTLVSKYAIHIKCEIENLTLSITNQLTSQLAIAICLIKCKYTIVSVFIQPTYS